MLLNIYEVLMLCSMVTLPPSLHASSNVWVLNPETHQSSQCTVAGENCDRSPRLTQLTLTAGNPGVRARRWGGNPLPVATGSVSVTSALGRIPPGLQRRGQVQAPHGVHLAAAPSPAPVPAGPRAGEGAAPGVSGPRRAAARSLIPRAPRRPGPASRHPGPAAFFLFIINI